MTTTGPMPTRSFIEHLAEHVEQLRTPAQLRDIAKEIEKAQQLERAAEQELRTPMTPDQLAALHAAFDRKPPSSRKFVSCRQCGEPFDERAMTADKTICAPCWNGIPVGSPQRQWGHTEDTMEKHLAAARAYGAAETVSHYRQHAETLASRLADAELEKAQLAREAAQMVEQLRTAKMRVEQLDQVHAELGKQLDQVHAELGKIAVYVMDERLGEDWLRAHEGVPMADAIGDLVLRAIENKTVDRRMKLVPIDRRSTGLPAGQPGTAMEFEAADGKPFYVVTVTRFVPMDLLQKLEQRLGKNRVFWQLVPPGAEIGVYEIVPAEPLDVARRR